MTKLLISDYERRRRVEETTNERAVSVVVVALTASLLLVSTAWTDFSFPFDVPWPVRLVTLTMLLSHILIFMVVVIQRGYSPLRKYLIVLVRIAILGSLCWAEWYHVQPEFGLVRPTSLFAVTIMLTALSYSRGAVLLAGTLACLVYPTVSLLGPVWPTSLQASIFAVQLYLAMTAAAFWLVSRMRTMADESVSNERLSRFFSPEIASRIAAEPHIALQAIECRVTVLFSDISAFTAMSSRMRPEEVVALLNAYFPRMVDIVFRHGGTLEKFIGDALLAVWGAPIQNEDNIDRAIAAATEMQEEVKRFNSVQMRAGQPTISIHVGIASGPAAAGYIGTASYLQYAVIGDTTNVAARICSAAGPEEILVAETTRRGHSGCGIIFEEIPAIAAKGKDGPITVYRVRKVSDSANSGTKI